MERTNTHLSPFVRSYIETALWSSTDNDGIPLDDTRYTDTELAEETIGKIIGDCERFQVAAEAFPGFSELTQPIAHDFWLTRNGHGAGFWDGDYPEPLATQLTDLAHSFGTCDLYIGDDGKIYAA